MMMMMMTKTTMQSDRIPSAQYCLVRLIVTTAAVIGLVLPSSYNIGRLWSETGRAL